MDCRWNRAVLALAVLLFGCPPKDEVRPDPASSPPPGGAPSGGEPGPAPSPGPAPAPPSAAGRSAAADIRSSTGLSGRATFVEKAGRVHVRIEVRTAPPGPHGVHIHEKGDCSDAGFLKAGGHFNPGNTPHGGPGTTVRHAGDFGNITVQADGTGVLELETDQITLDSGPQSVIGRAIIVHERADDLTTQPTGNSGSRIGCGVISAT
ncbi:MAG: superoxide dismutase family protein [Myxococcales bacterium]|nr:superoxide dismutase family protein [Myxococcota bacterium]MDW8280097.1 superoxide dismutase family protein [Myxococcales bacterium]